MSSQAPSMNKLFSLGVTTRTYKPLSPLNARHYFIYLSIISVMLSFFFLFVDNSSTFFAQFVQFLIIMHTNIFQVHTLLSDAKKRVSLLLIIGGISAFLTAITAFVRNEHYMQVRNLKTNVCIRVAMPNMSQCKVWELTLQDEQYIWIKADGVARNATLPPTLLRIEIIKGTDGYSRRMISATCGRNDPMCPRYRASKELVTQNPETYYRNTELVIGDDIISLDF